MLGALVSPGIGMAGPGGGTAHRWRKAGCLIACPGDVRENGIRKPDRRPSLGRRGIAGLLLLAVMVLYGGLLLVAAGFFYESDGRLFGMEQIVGAANVHYQDDGSYYYTNPAGMLLRYGLYLVLLVVLSRWPAGVCEERFRRHFVRDPERWPKSGRRWLFACLLAGIFLGIGAGIRSWAYDREEALRRDVNALTTVAQYERRLGPAVRHCPAVGVEQLERLEREKRSGKSPTATPPKPRSTIWEPMKGPFQELIARASEQPSYWQPTAAMRSTWSTSNATRRLMKRGLSRSKAIC